MCNDMGATSKKRLYINCFQCMSRTTIDEGRYALYKGAEFAAASALVRAILGLPVYEFVKSLEGSYISDGPLSDFYKRIGASMLSGMLLSTILYPLDTIKRTK